MANNIDINIIAKTLGIKSLVDLKAGLDLVGGAIQTVSKIIGPMIKSTDEFNKAFSNVTTMVDTSTVNVNQMQKSLLGLDSRLGSAKDLTDGLYQALSGGVDAAKAVEFVGEAAKFAKAGLTDTNTAVDLLTTTLNAYGKSAEETAHLSDVFFGVVKRGKTTGDELASTLGGVVPIAATLGVKIEDVGAAMVVMTKQGINTAEGTTQLTALMSAFIKPSEDMAMVLQKVGYESGSALIEAKGLGESLKIVSEATGGSTEALANIFPNIRAVRGAMALLGKEGENYAQIQKELEQETGITDEAFKKQEMTFEGMKSSVEKASIILGQKLIPFLYEGASAVTEFINNSKNMAILEKIMTNVMSGFTIVKNIVLELGKALWDNLGSVISNLQENFKTLTGATDKSSGTMNVFAGIVKGLSVGLSITSKLINIMIDYIFNVIEVYKQAIIVVGNFWQALTGKMKWKEAIDSINNVKDAFKDGVKTMWEDGKDLVSSTVKEFQKMPGEVKTLSQQMQDNYKSSYDNINNTVKNAMSEQIAAVDEATSQEVEIKKSKLEEIQEALLENKDMMLEMLTEQTETQSEMWEENLGAWGEQITEFTEANMEAFTMMFDVMSDKNSSTMDKINAGVQATGGVILATMGMVSKGIGEYYAKQIAGHKAVMDSEILGIDTKSKHEIELLENDGMTKKQARDKEIKDLKALLATTTDEKERAGLEDKIKTLEIEKKKEEITEKAEAAKQQAREEFAAKEKELKLKQFYTEKGIKIAEIWIQAAMGTIAAWASSMTLGPIAGPIMAGVMTGIIMAMAGVSTGVVASQQPSFASGGIMQDSGMALVGEQGPELVNLPAGAVVNTAGQTSNMMSNMGGETVIINISQLTVKSDRAEDLIEELVELRRYEAGRR